MNRIQGLNGRNHDAEEQLPPHSEEAEAALLGSILIDPQTANETLDLCKRDGVSRETFYDLRHRVIWAALVELDDALTPIDTTTLWQQLKLDRNVDHAGGMSYFAGLPELAPSSANIRHYIEIALEKQQRREDIANAQRLIELARDADPSEFSEGRRAILEHAVGTAGGMTERRIISFLGTRQFRPDVRPPEADPVFALGGVTICTRGNLSAITAAAKAGKTAFIGAMLASAMAPGGDTFGLSFSGAENLAVVHIDTEQSPFDHWSVLQTAMQRAGVETMPGRICSYCLTGEPASTIRRAVTIAAREAARRHGGVSCIIIDGIGDLVADVNDPEECNSLVAELHALAIELHCSIIGVIHFNPGSEKVRGHLGSQLERKCETNLRLEKDEESQVTDIYSIKQRRAPISRESGHRFVWSTDSGMHISAAAYASRKEEEAEQSQKIVIDDVFGSRASMRYKEIVEGFVANGHGSDGTARRRVGKWHADELIAKEVAGLWVRNYEH